MKKLYVVPVGSLELHFFDINMHFESLHWGKNKEWSWIYIGYEIWHVIKYLTILEISVRTRQSDFLLFFLPRITLYY